MAATTAARHRLRWPMKKMRNQQLSTFLTQFEFTFIMKVAGKYSLAKAGASHSVVVSTDVSFYLLYY